jgi:hypothetical protein
MRNQTVEKNAGYSLSQEMLIIVVSEVSESLGKNLWGLSGGLEVGWVVLGGLLFMSILP